MGARRNVFLDPEQAIAESFRPMAELLAKFKQILPASLQADSIRTTRALARTPS